MSKGFPKYRIIDKYRDIWFTWNIAWTREEALKIVIQACNRYPGRAVKLEEIKEARSVRSYAEARRTGQDHPGGS